MLLRSVYLKDIREYEESTGKNILRFFDKCSVSNMIEFIHIFKKELTEEEICRMLDDYLSDENNGIVDAYLELRQALLGYKSDENDEVVSDEEDTEQTYEDITQYEFLSDYYMKLCSQLMSLGVTYTEFWSFTTKEMYQVYKSINNKLVMDINRQLEMAYVQAGLFGAGVWGKLPEKVPQIDLDNDDEKIVHTPYGDMTQRDYKSLMVLERLGG